jgi:hypothetical protein
MGYCLPFKRCTNSGPRWQEFVSRAVRLRIFHLLEILVPIGGDT